MCSLWLHTVNHWKADKQPVALECSAGKDGAGRVSRVVGWLHWSLLYVFTHWKHQHARSSKEIYPGIAESIPTKKQDAAMESNISLRCSALKGGYSSALIKGKSCRKGWKPLPVQKRLCISRACKQLINFASISINSLKQDSEFHQIITGWGGALHFSKGRYGGGYLPGSKGGKSWSRMWAKEEQGQKLRRVVGH